jgi:hypothetical protein
MTSLSLKPSRVARSFHLGQRGADLVEIPAFDQGQAVLHHFATLPQVDQTLTVMPGCMRYSPVCIGVPARLKRQ